MFTTGAKIADRLMLKITVSTGQKSYYYLCFSPKYDVSQLHFKKALHDP
jgi:hypothetical protein